MKSLLTRFAVAWACATLAWVIAASLPAQEQPETKKQAEAKAAEAEQVAGLQEQLRRVTAALNVLEKSDQPDTRRIANLTRRKDQLQTQLKELGVEPESVGQTEQAGVPGEGRVCPFGFTPLGPGPRAGRGGGGQGVCPWNAADGGDGSVAPGAGAGQGPPPWAGGGQGRGMGRGMGPGMGSGMGRGQGNGGGAGWGWGRGGGRGMGGGGRGAGL